MNKPITVSVIAQDANSAAGVCSVIASLGYCAQSFRTPEEFYDSAELGNFCCVVLCTNDGISLAHQFQSRFQEQRELFPSIIIAANVGVRDAVKLMEGEAMTVLNDHYDPEELANYLQSAVHLDQARRASNQRIAELKICRAILSERQLAVLLLVEQGRSNKQIAAHFNLSQRTIELERARLMSAFESSTVAQLVSKSTELRLTTKLWCDADKVPAASDTTTTSA